MPATFGENLASDTADAYRALCCRPRAALYTLRAPGLHGYLLRVLRGQFLGSPFDTCVSLYVAP
eukprot:7672202-Alexandrium_andersonii.AAC.1